MRAAGAGRPLGVVDVTFWPEQLPVSAARAKRLGFDHIDVSVEWEGELALPVGDRMSASRVQPGWSVPLLRDGPGQWDRAVELYRSVPGICVEPWPGSIGNSVQKIEALLDAVPGLGLLLDVGHVASWGEDPVDLVPRATHIQLRQAAEGVPQRHPDDGGDVDFAVLLDRLDQYGFAGRLSIEYFDLPELGWPLEDPVACAVSLADRLRPLLSR